MLETLIGKEVTVHIPSNNPVKLTDIATFDRILAELWYNGVEYAKEIIKRGLGFETKKEQEEYYNGKGI